MIWHLKSGFRMFRIIKKKYLCSFKIDPSDNWGTEDVRPRRMQETLINT